MTKLSGRWLGRLIDAAGFEGELMLDLRTRQGTVRGSYDMQLATHHGGEPARGSLSGEFDGTRVTLLLKPEKDSAPEVKFTGDAFDTGNGAGMKGIYTVSPRKNSPLVGGVIAASTEDAHPHEQKVENPDPDAGKGD